MTTFERHQTILRLLQSQPSVKVSELARLLNVSEGTIRNDLSALDQDNKIKRVRGGAVAMSATAPHPDALATRAQVNFDLKQRIANYAAGMIEDGDAVLLDASTTVLSMAPFLRDRHHLTIVTNGIEVAQRLAEDPSNTVILLGGILRSNGSAVGGTLAEKILKDLHIRAAFVSCSGFSLETGLMEKDIQEAQLKSLMIQAAQRAIALIDSTKFGKFGLTPFAQPEAIAHIVTDSDAPPGVVEQLQRQGTRVTICGESTVASYVSRSPDRTRYKIGFANLGENMPFARDVRRGLERAAKANGAIDLVVADNQLSGEVALAVADDLLAQGIDLAIEFQIDAVAGNLIINKFNKAGVPVIAVDIPMVGATFLGVDNYQVGHVAGINLGEAVRRKWEGAYDYLIVLEHPRPGDLPALRIKGQLDGFFETLGEVCPPEWIITLDCGNTAEVSQEQMRRVLHRLPEAHRLPVICFNDDAAIGALVAAQSLGREADVLIVGQGADRRLRDELHKRVPQIVGSTAFRPELYGGKLVEIAVKILKGESVPPAVYIPHTFIDADNVDVYYPVSDDER